MKRRAGFALTRLHGTCDMDVVRAQCGSVRWSEIYCIGPNLQAQWRRPKPWTLERAKYPVDKAEPHLPSTVTETKSW